MSENEINYNRLLKKSVDDNIYCFCWYEGRHIPKQLGFKWNPNLKLWFIPKKDFTLKIYENSLVVRYTSHTSIGNPNYYYVNYIKGGPK